MSDVSIAQIAENRRIEGFAKLTNIKIIHVRDYFHLYLNKNITLQLKRFLPLQV